LFVEKLITEEENIRGRLPSDSPPAEPEQAARGEGEPVPEGRKMLRYLLTAAAVMALLYVAPFFLAFSPLYDRVDPSWPLNYPFEIAGQNADVVIFGDSTALMGIDPSQMSDALGVNVLNLVNTQPSLVVNNDMSLRHYLKRNRPPKLLIFYFAPWDFDYEHNGFYSRPKYEGEQLLLRHGTWQEIRPFVRKHPREAVLFPLSSYLSAWEFTLHHIPRPNHGAQLTATRGHLDNLDPTIMTAACRFPRYLVDHVHFSGVHDLGERYRTPETKVLFYVAAVPACGNVSEVLDLPYDELPANPPKAFPPEFFASDIRTIHPRPIAVPELTRNLSDAARPLLAPAP